MKKTYNKPVLTTEQFDVQDIITVSSPGPADTLDTVNTNSAGSRSTWEVTNLPFGF